MSLSVGGGRPRRVWYWLPWKLTNPLWPWFWRGGDEYGRDTIVIQPPLLGALIIAKGKRIQAWGIGSPRPAGRSRWPLLRRIARVDRGPFRRLWGGVTGPHASKPPPHLLGGTMTTTTSAHCGRMMGGDPRDPSCLLPPDHEGPCSEERVPYSLDDLEAAIDRFRAANCGCCSPNAVDDAFEAASIYVGDDGPEPDMPGEALRRKMHQFGVDLAYYTSPGSK